MSDFKAFTAVTQAKIASETRSRATFPHGVTFCPDDAPLIADTEITAKEITILRDLRQIAPLDADVRQLELFR